MPSGSPLLAYVNGELVPEDAARVSVFDSSLHFGDGAFESMRVYAGRIFRLEDHLQRLWHSINSLDIPFALTKDELSAEIRKWLSANQATSKFHIKVIVTRGNRHPPRLDPRFVTGGPTVIFAGSRVASGLKVKRVVVAGVKRPGREFVDPSVKTTSFAGAVLARAEAEHRGADDALMLDQSGFVVGATASNIFLVKRGQLVTPNRAGCFPGITRSTVIDLALGLGLEVLEADISRQEIPEVEEVFLTGTSSEISAVVEIDEKAVGDARVGAVTEGLYAAYMDNVLGEKSAVHMAET